MRLRAEGDTPWLWSAGPDSDVAVCSRVRLSRNLSDAPYPGTADERARTEVTKRLSQAIRRVLVTTGTDGPPFAEYEPRAMGRPDQEALIEARLLEYPLPWRLFTARSLSFSVGSVDHLRMVAFEPGAATVHAHDQLRSIEEGLEELLPFAVSLDAGYLSTEVTNAGTAMRAGVLLHLPALAAMGRMDVLDASVGPGFSLRPDPLSTPAEHAAEEGTDRAPSGLYLLRNERTLGASETEILSNLEDHSSALVHYERVAREEILATVAEELRHEALSALELLRLTRSLPVVEAVRMLSKLRLSVALRLVEEVEMETVTSLLFLSRRHHVLNPANGNDEVIGEDENTVRARLVRESLVE